MKRSLVVHVSVVLVTMLLLAPQSRAQVVTTAVNMRVGMLSVYGTGALFVAPEPGTFKTTTGDAAPSCMGGMLNFAQNSAGTAYSDVNRDRLLQVLTAAQLSGRTIQVSVSRNAFNQCFIEGVSMTNT